VNYQRRFEKLLAAAQAEIFAERQLGMAQTTEERRIALVNLEEAREHRNSVLEKWGLFPPTT